VARYAPRLPRRARAALEATWARIVRSTARARAGWRRMMWYTMSGGVRGTLQSKQWITCYLLALVAPQPRLRRRYASSVYAEGLHGAIIPLRGTAPSGGVVGLLAPCQSWVAIQHSTSSKPGGQSSVQSVSQSPPGMQPATRGW
jgi:hypothetical protein